MIFVITGSEAYPFDRLIKEIDLLKKNKIITDDVFVQLGSCNYTPSSCSYEKWLPFNKMRENIASSELVISHAGAGTTLLCLEMGKIPIIVTRRKKYGEHLDDHQLEFSEMMDKLGYAKVAYDVSELSDVYKNYQKKNSDIPVTKSEKKTLISALNNWMG